MSESTNCKLCNRSHMGGLSCFYGISKNDRKPFHHKNNPSGKKSTARKLLKNKYNSDKPNISFKQYIKV